MERNCHRCGKEYDALPKVRVCAACKRPRIRAARPIPRTLTLRQKQLAGLVVKGKLNKEIAFDLHLSEGTIKTYLSAIFKKLGVTNRTELAVLTLKQDQQGLVRIGERLMDVEEWREMAVKALDAVA